MDNAGETQANYEAGQEYFKKEIQRIYYKSFGNENFVRKLKLNNYKPLDV